MKLCSIDPTPIASRKARNHGRTGNPIGRPVGSRSAKQAEWQPCFTCPLRECDDKSPRCAYRKAIAVYNNALRHGEPLTDEMRTRYAAAGYELYGAHRRTA